MYADLSRVTFRADRYYSAVLAQQGRVQLDADLNEQAVIQLSQIRALTADLIGPDGGPRDAAGFAVTHVVRRGEPADLTIGRGRYYVAGIPCDASRPVPGIPVPDDGVPQEPEEPSSWTYWEQPDGFRDPDRPGDRLPEDFPYLAYLRGWERSVTAAEDPAFSAWSSRPDAPRMAARARRPDDAEDDPCLVKPDARYRGPENQLYRVEIHVGGPSEQATLKWSRENGSVVFGVDAIDARRKRNERRAGPADRQRTAGVPTSL